MDLSGVGRIKTLFGDFELINPLRDVSQFISSRLERSLIS